MYHLKFMWLPGLLSGILLAGALALIFFMRFDLRIFIGLGLFFYWIIPVGTALLLSYVTQRERVAFGTGVIAGASCSIILLLASIIIIFNVVNNAASLTSSPGLGGADLSGIIIVGMIIVVSIFSVIGTLLSIGGAKLGSSNFLWKRYTI